MLQAILDGQVTIHKEIKEVRDEVKKNGERIDKLGKQLAYVEDDTPTREEFNELKVRMDNVESKVAPI